MRPPTLHFLGTPEKAMELRPAAFKRYDAGPYDRLIRRFDTTLGSADAELAEVREEMVAFSRTLDAISDVYHGAVNGLVRLVVGPQLTPRGLNPAAKLAAKKFREHADRPGAMDVEGLKTFGQLQRQAFRGVVVDGDVLAIKLASGRLQLVPAELITPPGGGVDVDERQAEGVEVDEAGRVVAYHVAEHVPTGQTVNPAATRPIDAWHALFLRSAMRVSQRRGAPILHAALAEIAMMHQYVRSYAANATQSANMVAVIESPSPTQSASAVRAPNATASDRLLDRETGRDRAYVNEASILHVPMGTKVNTIQASHPNANAEAMINGAMMRVAACAGVPASILFADTRGASFSTTKIARQQAVWAIEELRQDFVSSFCRPVYEWWRARAIRAGELPDDDDSLRVGWIGRAMPHAQPEKEVLAAQHRIDARFSTFQEEAAELYGRDWEEDVLPVLESEYRQLDARNLRPAPPPGSVEGATQRVEAEEAAEAAAPDVEDRGG